MSQSQRLTLEEIRNRVREVIDREFYRNKWSVEAVGLVSTASTPNELRMALRYFLNHPALQPFEKRELLAALDQLSGMD